MIYLSIIILIFDNVLKFLKNYIKQNLSKLRFTYIVVLFILSINFLVFYFKHSMSSNWMKRTGYYIIFINYFLYKLTVIKGRHIYNIN